MNLDALTDAELDRQADELHDAAEKLSDDNVFKAQIIGIRDELYAEIERREEEREAKEEAEWDAHCEATHELTMRQIFGEDWSAATNGAA